MRDFKFFSDNVYESLENEDGWNGASWLFGGRENLNLDQYHIVIEYHNGIHSFLNQFPPGFIVTILSITGPNNRIHTGNTEYDDGWGFDITNDLISVEWARFSQ